MRQYIFLLILSLLIISCQDKIELAVPKILGNLEVSKVISGEEAIVVINKLHGLPVSATKNIIAEYGDERKDLLYLSYFEDTEEAQKVFRQMIAKMMNAKNSPFTQRRSGG